MFSFILTRSVISFFFFVGVCFGISAEEQVYEGAGVAIESAADEAGKKGRHSSSGTGWHNGMYIKAAVGIPMPFEINFSSGSEGVTRVEGSVDAKNKAVSGGLGLGVKIRNFRVEAGLNYVPR